jgi:hypothetical protein
LLQASGDEISVSVAGDNFNFSASGEHGITPLGVIGLPTKSAISKPKHKR